MTFNLHFFICQEKNIFNFFPKVLDKHADNRYKGTKKEKENKMEKLTIDQIYEILIENSETFKNLSMDEKGKICMEIFNVRN